MNKIFLWVILCYSVLCFVDARGVNVGLCDDWIYNCRCGSEAKNYLFQLHFKQCTYFNKWRMKCEPCNGQEPDKKCSPYSQCLECKTDQDGCVTCPEGKFGLWCNGDCKCQNGGTCDRMTGNCICPPVFKGTFCESRALCDEPEEISGLTWEGSSRKISDVIIARCKPGYTLIGAKSRTCSVNGSWDSLTSICEPICKFPTLGAHVKSQINPEMVNKSFDADNKEIVKEIKFLCDPGYTLVGSHRLQCQPTGEWDSQPPQCQVLKVCPDPGTPSKGNRIVIDAIDGAFVPGTSVKYQCNHGYFLSGSELITCISSGRWSDKIPQCPPVTGCPPPDVPNNGIVSITKAVARTSRMSSFRVVSRLGSPFKKNNTIEAQPTTIKTPPGYSITNSKALYSCKSIYYKLDGSESRICMPNGVWSGKQPACKALCGQSYEAKRPTIVNGVTSVLGKWPWQVAIYYAASLDKNDNIVWALYCGGSLLNENWVVTAAHCVTESKISKLLHPDDFKIYLGKYFANTSLDDKEVKLFAIKKIIVHPNFHPRSLDSDIALIELSQPVEFSTRIQPICLPDASGINKLTALEDSLPEASTGVAVGWGFMFNNNNSLTQASVLQEAKLAIVNRSFCEEEYRLQNQAVSVTANMFCAGWPEGGASTCKGDSGGPFMVEEKNIFGNMRWVLRGIMSWGGKVCGAPHQYGGLLNVVNFVSWIEQYV